MKVEQPVDGFYTFRKELFVRITLYCAQGRFQTIFMRG